jgi:hypothetical protein
MGEYLEVSYRALSFCGFKARDSVKENRPEQYGEYFNTEAVLIAL